MDMRAKTCCFIGHRSLNGAEKLTVGVRLRKTIKELIKQGVVLYGAGGALGFDTLAAQTVLDMKKEYPQLCLILVLPCEDQTRGWRSEDIAVYEDIKRRSDKVVYLHSDKPGIKDTFIRDSDFYIRISDGKKMDPNVKKFYEKLDLGAEVHRLDYLLMSMRGLRTQIEGNSAAYKYIIEAIDILQTKRNLDG